MTRPQSVPPGSFGPSALATPANAVTIARLLLTPFWLVVFVSNGPSWSAFGIGFLLASTDGVDGYIARRQGTTRSGAFLDPLADKFLVVGGLVMLVAQGAFWWVPVAIITAREMIISIYRSWVARRGISVPARYWAKVKTVVQEFAIAFALLPTTAGTPWLAKGVLWIGAGLAVFTGAQYLLDGRRLQLSDR
ncbi:MAG: CDP-diacylglycerol--glycerol-3-phosphate 3-phosphatidyltransferase [uncultured Acidimicrobiales bacterium]|uniref:CDP-diacylglycerol--glycerol-3-phosphate 3-phosphatidyltransferase n=1 Tax=uncultured Acidimicrobiales bacterium TaxID=310071 RepID=A0A6J4HJY3_9ACTN|nr:MAG: CDP-diacylglycerol--glycerol-3-phosphate 3-phosphatidyltransferase [uncultured Acidimicrobiales bacterium]